MSVSCYSTTLWLVVGVTCSCPYQNVCTPASGRTGPLHSGIPWQKIGDSVCEQKNGNISIVTGIVTLSQMSSPPVLCSCLRCKNSQIYLFSFLILYNYCMECEGDKEILSDLRFRSKWQKLGNQRILCHKTSKGWNISMFTLMSASPPVSFPPVSFPPVSFPPVSFPVWHRRECQYEK